jgi:hypothetical protein
VARGLTVQGGCRGLRLGPGIVGADAPEVAFGVAAGEGAASIGHIGYVQDDLGFGGFGCGVDGVGVVDDEAGALGAAEADLVGLDDELVVGGAFFRFGYGAEHDHAVPEGELGVHDGDVVRGEVDGLPFEAEGLDEPVDGGEGVAVAKGGDDGGAGGFGVVRRVWRGCHGRKDAIGWGWLSWTNESRFILINRRAMVPALCALCFSAASAMTFQRNKAWPRTSFDPIVSARFAGLIGYIRFSLNDSAI